MSARAGEAHEAPGVRYPGPSWQDAVRFQERGWCAPVLAQSAHSLAPCARCMAPHLLDTPRQGKGVAARASRQGPPGPAVGTDRPMRAASAPVRLELPRQVST
jgi:hypothetical protein